MATVVPENESAKSNLLPKADPLAGGAGAEGEKMAGNAAADCAPSAKKSESPAKPEVKPQVRVRVAMKYVSGRLAKQAAFSG